MARTPPDLDEFVEHRTLLKDERALVSGKRGATRRGFAVPLKFSTRYGRFPRGRAELPGEAVEFAARQVRVPASEPESYDGPHGRVPPRAGPGGTVGPAVARRASSRPRRAGATASWGPLRRRPRSR
ncbi:DUF4158 domain-containing protein [Streptomyces halstedii]|uniref:DUF4158 domain-containing protein n=1 Tax=Streptomyces halstedii TaxID=1944 RepID=UPI003801DDC4